MRHAARSAARLCGLRLGAHFAPKPRTRRTKKASALLTLMAVVCGAAMTAGAATTVSPTQPGSPPFTRDDIVNITVNPVAALFTRTLATSNFTRPSILLASCVGDNPAGVNNSPRTTVKVTGPGGEVVTNATSPVLTRGLGGAAGGYPETNPQPAPGDTNWRGGSYGSTTPGAPSASNTTRPWVVATNLAGKPGGIYTVTTTTQNMVKTGTGACTIGTPPATSATAFGNTFAPGPIVETSTFEYRPWQHRFTDLFGGGSVKMNVTPAEFQQTLGTQSGAIHDGTTMQFFDVPSGDFVALPSDPNACGENPASCLPSTATSCDPSAGCEPRIVVIDYDQYPTEQLFGFFDIETGAFVSYSEINGTTRTMLSLGRDQDAIYRDLLAQLGTAAYDQGVDLAALLATKVRLRTGSDELSVSLLQGLQLAPAPGKPAGVQIVSDTTAQAGLILDIYAGISPVQCVANSGDSNPATAAPDRYTPAADVGYTVEKSDLLPEVPRIGAVGALVGGPIYHITGDFVGGGSQLVNTAAAVIGVDTAADEPNGYPVWIEPFVSTPTHVAAPKTMDFLGTATWSASESSLGALGCLSVNFMLGAGVAIYNNPLPVGFGTLPIWDPQAPEVQALMAQVNGAVQTVVNSLVGDPTVAALLEQITGSLPPVEGVPSV